MLDPARNVDQRQEMSLLIQLQLKSPVLQVAAGKFGSSKFSADNQLLIAALHPHSIAYFQLKQSAGSSDEFVLDSVLENKITGPPAFNFCQGQFGKSSIEQLCVQSINCALTIFEGEHKVLTRHFEELAAIHPGPLEYTPFSDSILVTSVNGCLSSIRYRQVLPM